MRLQSTLVFWCLWLRSLVTAVVQSSPVMIPSQAAVIPSQLQQPPQLPVPPLGYNGNNDALFLKMFKSFVEGPYDELVRKVDRLEKTISSLQNGQPTQALDTERRNGDSEQKRVFLGRFREMMRPVTASERRADRITFGFCSLVYSIFCGMSFMKDTDMKKNCVDLPIEHYRTCFPAH